MEERRLALAVALSLAVLLIWQLVFKPTLPPKPPEPATQQTTSTPSTTVPPSTVATLQPATGISTSETSLTPVAGGALEPTPPSTSETRPPTPKEVQVETDLYKCVISTAGGYLKSFQLKNFKETAAKNSGLKELVSPNLPPQKGPLLLTLNVGGGTLPQLVTYAPSVQEIDLEGKPDGAAQTLKLALTTTQGYIVERIYTFTNGDYRVGAEVRVSETPHGTDEVAPRRAATSAAFDWFTWVDQTKTKSRFGTFAAITFANNSFEKEAPSKIKKKGPFKYSEPVWTGFADSYFLAAMIPEGKAAEATSSVEGEENNQIVTQQLEFPEGTVAPGQPQVYRAQVYLGPKDFKRLKAMGEDLNLYRAVEYGRLEEYFRLVTILVSILKMFNKLVHNWGLSIVLLTVFVKVLFFPLTRSSFKQMKAMQALQPRVKELQEKYKNDRVKMNEEMMGLYRTHKVNPLGGCLPMLLQLPVLYALYRTLYVSIDLRYAPFIGWINDLSSPERIFSLPLFGGVDVGIMPLLMGVSMYVQQKMTPTTMDPMQAKMFMMMPVMFTFISFGFPSGLVLYWLVSNLLTIAQQYVINRRGT